MNGAISKVQLNWVQQLVFGYSDTVSSATWKAALPHMFVWFDYASIPQPSCKLPLHESLFPQDVSRRGSCFSSFYSSFVSVASSIGGTDSDRDSGETPLSKDDETKGEPQGSNTTDHRHTCARSSAKHWLGEAVKVSADHRFELCLKERGDGEG